MAWTGVGDKNRFAGGIGCVDAATISYACRIVQGLNQLLLSS